MEFVVLPHKDSKDVFILGGTDEIQQLLDDSNINVATIASSRHVGPIKSRVEDWSRQLDLFGKTLVINLTNKIVNFSMPILSACKAYYHKKI